MISQFFCFGCVKKKCVCPSLKICRVSWESMKRKPNYSCACQTDEDEEDKKNFDNPSSITNENLNYKTYKVDNNNSASKQELEIENNNNINAEMIDKCLSMSSDVENSEILNENDINEENENSNTNTTLENLQKNNNTILQSICGLLIVISIGFFVSQQKFVSNALSLTNFDKSEKKHINKKFALSLSRSLMSANYSRKEISFRESSFQSILFVIQEYVGIVIAIISGILYMSARLPQLLKTCCRGTVEGSFLFYDFLFDLR